MLKLADCKNGFILIMFYNMTENRPDMDESTYSRPVQITTANRLLVI